MAEILLKLALNTNHLFEPHQIDKKKPLHGKVVKKQSC
jgi:hypothetical protein